MKELNYQASPVTIYEKYAEHANSIKFYSLEKKPRKVKIIHRCQSIGGCANRVWVQVLPLTRRWWLCLGRLCNLEGMKWRWEKSGFWGVPSGLYSSWFQPSPGPSAGLRGEQAELPASTEWTEVPPPPPLTLSPH